jgi:hypothetical protein
MDYGKPVKLQDGRYFVKISSKDGGRVLKQLNNVEVQDAHCFKVSCDLKEYDDQIISQAEVCSEEWFGKKVDLESLKKAFDSSVTANILESPPVPKKTKVFDCERKEVTLDVLTNGTRCDVIVELSGIWFLKKSFGPVWRLVQARLKKESTFPHKYIFEDEESEDDDEYN